MYEQSVSLLGSWLAWKPHLAKYKYNKDCPYCEELGRVSIPKFVSENNPEGLVRCICEVYRHGQIFRKQSDLFNSRYLESRTLDNIVDRRGAPQANAKFVATELSRWLRWPSCWITLLGGVGVGKTHILSAIMDELVPYSLYVTMGDLESMFFRAKEQGTLPMIEEVLMYFPVLLLDDVGAEYGGRFAESVLTRVIDFRYRTPFEFITVCASNLNKQQLYVQYPRVADRILDRTISTTFAIAEKSYRR